MGEYTFPVDPRSAAEAGSELAIQSRFRSQMRMLSPKTRLVAVPNGGQRSAWASMKAKAEGMSAGFEDLIAMAPGGRIAFLEFKAKDGALSDAQTDWLNWHHHNGFPVGVFRGAASAIDFLRNAGFPFVDYKVLCGAGTVAA